MDKCTGRRRYEAKENRILLNRKVSLHSIATMHFQLHVQSNFVLIASWHHISYGTACDLGHIFDPDS